MTIATNARIAGITYFVYLAAGMSSLAMAGNAPGRAVAGVFESFSALVLAVTLYAITREQDPDIALIAMLSRAIEAVPGEGFIYSAVGSLLFAWLLLRGRMIPSALAGLGVGAALLLVTQLLVQRALDGATDWSSPVTWAAALPMLVFELTFAVWLVTRGVNAPTRARRTSRAGP